MGGVAKIIHAGLPQTCHAPALSFGLRPHLKLPLAWIDTPAVSNFLKHGLQNADVITRESPGRHNQRSSRSQLW